jgi:glucuronate isomerase
MNKSTNQQQVRPFLDKNFLLNSDTAQYLYHDHAARMPIIDYHNHLPPSEIALDIQFENITQAWLKGDHYKWRAMRTNGVNESFITGAKSDLEKFKNWAMTVPYTLRNPLYHWTHLELKRYFEIDEVLSLANAEKVYVETQQKLQTVAYSTQQLLLKMNVEVVCTTDDPIDNLEYHINLAAQNLTLNVRPTFRPDRILFIQQHDYNDYIHQLEQASEMTIRSLNDLLEALHKRITYFHQHGCRLSDHGLERIDAQPFTMNEVSKIFQKKLEGGDINNEECDRFRSALLYFLAVMYHDQGWVMQFHLGALRNNNERLLGSIGADVGCDSIGDFPQGVDLSNFLNRLDKDNRLTKTILYNLNPADNELFATMVGNFNDGSIPGKIQWGSAWWFLDQKDGMEKQINTLSNMGLLSRFVGMLTDSRSFLSFPRHEYFRRILCNLIGQDVENGLLPHDLPWLGKVVENISYHNAKEYFNF